MIKKIKVLVLDDSELQRAKIQDLFLNNEEFELIGCLNDGLEGINIVRDEQPDVVIADIVLQNYDGFELLEKIKEMNFVSKPKILILSSLKGDDFAQKALDLGASYYMVKPVAEEILLKRIKSLVDSNANGDTQIIRNGRNRALEEKISNTELFEESIMLGLRTKYGVNLKDIKEKYNIDLYETKKDELASFLKMGVIEINNDNLVLTDTGYPILNKIILELVY